MQRLDASCTLWSCGGGTGRSHTHGRGMWDAAKGWKGDRQQDGSSLSAAALRLIVRPLETDRCFKGHHRIPGLWATNCSPRPLGRSPTGPPQTSSTTGSLQTKGKFTTAVKRKDWLPLRGDDRSAATGGVIFWVFIWELLNSVFVHFEKIHWARLKGWGLVPRMVTRKIKWLEG